MYRVTIDKDACAGIFACLVRDDRFVEADDGLASIAPDAGEIHEDDGTVVAHLEENIESARQAAAACPPDAITVEKLDEESLQEAERCP